VDDRFDVVMEKPDSGLAELVYMEIEDKLEMVKTESIRFSRDTRHQDKQDEAALQPKFCLIFRKGFSAHLFWLFNASKAFKKKRDLFP